MRTRNLLLALAALALPALAFLGGASPASAKALSSGSTGYDISFPQCPSSLPRGGSFGIVGVTDGLPWSANPCLASQYRWASSLPSPASFYTNTANPGPSSPHWGLTGPGTCVDKTSNADTGCAYNYGWNAAEQAFGVAANATSATIAASLNWWLDVETANSWNGTTAANVAAIQGYLGYLQAQHVPLVGIYSTSSQWSTITGGSNMPAVPNWLPGATSAKTAATYCGTTGFTGGPVRLVQYPSGRFDGDYACP